MGKNILIIDGHPDAAPARFCHALATAYAEAARSAGHGVEILQLSSGDVPLLRTRQRMGERTTAAGDPRGAGTIGWAKHLVIIYPLWLGTMPAHRLPGADLPPSSQPSRSTPGAPAFSVSCFVAA